MNCFVCVFVCLAVAVCAVHAEDLVLTDDIIASYAEAFQNYQVKFNKHYDSQEEKDKRLRVYAKSMENVKKWNEQYGGKGMTFGETSRSDLLEEEQNYFGNRISSPVPRTGKREENFNQLPPPMMSHDLDHTADNVPSEFSWFDIPGVKHPAKDQGLCGSCWAFSAIGQLEMQAFLEGIDYMSISEQHAIDCVTSNITHGCCGGWPGDVFDQIDYYITEASYPYELMDGSSECNPSSCRSKGKTCHDDLQAYGYDSFFPMTASELKEQIWVYGPISIWMNATNELNSYTGGVFNCENMTGVGGHYVIAVGFGPDYLILRNSWGADWGEEGDFRLSIASDEASCQMLTESDNLQLVRVAVDHRPREISGGPYGPNSKEELSGDSAFRAMPLLILILLTALLL